MAWIMSMICEDGVGAIAIDVFIGMEGSNGSYVVGLGDGTSVFIYCDCGDYRSVF